MRDDAHKRADNRPRRACTAHGLLGLVARLVLEPLHCQIGDEQKRDKVQRVLDGVLENVPDEMRDVFHDPCLAIERCPCLRMRRMRSVCQVPSLQNASSEHEETVNGG